MARKKRKPRVICIVLAVFAVMVLFLFYGPFPQFRLLWINTAMYSSRFKFLATAFYPRAYIDKVLERAFPAEQTSPETLLSAESSRVDITEVKGEYFKGFIISADDPGSVILITAKDEQGSMLEDLVAGAHVSGGINASGYRDDKKRGLPWGTLIADGIMASRCTEHGVHSIGGLTRTRKLVVGRMTDSEIDGWDFEWAVEFGPILIVNGEKTEINSYTGGLAPRTAIGQTQEGRILLLVIDGRRPDSIGATYKEMQTVLFENGAINAIGLDGGSSSSMVFNGKLVNRPSEGNDERHLPNAIVIRQ